MFHALLYGVGQGLQLDGLAHERLVMKVVWVFGDAIPKLHQRGDNARIQIFPQIHALPEKL